MTREEKDPEKREEARSVSLQTALYPMRRRALPTLISSKAQSEERGRGGGRERNGGKGGSANLGRSSEAPENIGHWPIFH